MLYTFEFEKIQTKGPIVPLNFMDLCPVDTPETTTERHTVLLNNTTKQKKFFESKTIQLYVQSMKEQIQYFYEQNPNFKASTTKQEFYQTYYIPKRKGGKRRIDDPCGDLKTIQKSIADFLERLRFMPHTCAHAYSKKRGIITNAEPHKQHRYIINIDLKNFFPSMTKEILRNQLKDLYLFEFMYTDQLFNDIIDIACLNNSLPQGSPLSPLLSNLAMTWFDYTLIEHMKDRKIPSYQYTRYADDMTFSSDKLTNIDKFVRLLQNLLDDVFGPDRMLINNEKTKVVKTTRKAYITGIKINKDHKLSYGYEKKIQLKKDLHNILCRLHNNEEVSTEERQQIIGTIAFMNQIEPGYTDYFTRRYAQLFRIPRNDLFSFIRNR